MILSSLSTAIKAEKANIYFTRNIEIVQCMNGKVSV